MTTYKVERLCTWSGMIGVVLFFCGFIFSQFIPPPSPSWTQEQVVAHYVEHASGIRTGMVLMMISGLFISPMVGVISAQLKRMKGISPALVYAQISGGTRPMPCSSLFRQVCFSSRLTGLIARRN
jgi:hypothetical protein